MIGSLQEFKTYQSAMKFGETVWKVVREWDWFARKSIGIQLVSAADSVAANLAESLGRYSTKEARQFCFYARGSLFETNSWIDKAYQRNLMNEQQHQELQEQLNNTGRMLNGYINSLGRFTSEPPPKV
ncbi:MAG: four helix bundle protein [Cyclobacteriaceae bacterium]|jgi:four helix bundle protein|nr:four helix bundle protein [Cytophagales bacterium]HNP76224.1 four helix bundle protein [Cyclobacteriaceae bacterium]HQQ83143.1 four helix bundle protein [Cyclobacteriaceae bacterium]